MAAAGQYIGVLYDQANNVLKNAQATGKPQGRHHIGQHRNIGLRKIRSPALDRCCCRAVLEQTQEPDSTCVVG